MDLPMKLEMWVEEYISGNASTKFKVRETLFSDRSKFQKVDLLETHGYGKMLFLDGVVMLSERDEFVYHDMIAHPILFAHPKPSKVLVIGGGDGGTAREALRHNDVEHVTMVEIDGMVVDVCKKFIPQTAKDLDHPKLDLRIEDGVKFMAETDQRFDAILIDSTDPIGPAEPLFGPEFYSTVYRVLADDGVVVAQGESTFYEVEAQKSILSSIKANFPRVHLYNYHNLCYPGGMWSFAVGSKGLCPVKDFDPQRVADSGLEFEYYNAEVHKAAFMLPNFQRKELAEYLTPVW